MAQRKNRIGTPFHKSVSYMFLTYWTVLVIWQNVSRIQERSSLDMFIKI